MSKQVNTNYTKLVRLDAGWHKILKQEALDAEKSIKEVLEDFLTEHWELKLDKKENV